MASKDIRGRAKENRGREGERKFYRKQALLCPWKKIFLEGYRVGLGWAKLRCLLRARDEPSPLTFYKKVFFFIGLCFLYKTGPEGLWNVRMDSGSAQSEVGTSGCRGAQGCHRDQTRPQSPQGQCCLHSLESRSSGKPTPWQWQRASPLQLCHSQLLSRLSGACPARLSWCFPPFVPHPFLLELCQTPHVFHPATVS